MRYVVVQVTPVTGSFESLPDANVAVDRGPFHHLQLLDDGTAVQLRAVDGDLDGYRERLAETEECLSYLVSGDESGVVYAHFEPTDLARAMLEWRARSSVAIESTIEYEGADLVITLVGDESRFGAALDRLPEGVTYSVLELGKQPPSAGGLFRGLTERQREVLSAAVEAGYYTNPRDATLADVAAGLDVTPGTVGDHLRSIEATVFSQFDGGS